MYIIFQISTLCIDWWNNLKSFLGQAPVAHACNPSYSGGRDQENHSSKPALGNSSWDAISKILKYTKSVGEVSQGANTEFKIWYHKNKIIFRLSFNFYMEFKQMKLQIYLCELNCIYESLLAYSTLIICLKVVDIFTLWCKSWAVCVIQAQWPEI
jgi:hypothetical protein